MLAAEMTSSAVLVVFLEEVACQFFMKLRVDHSREICKKDVLAILLYMPHNRVNSFSDSK